MPEPIVRCDNLVKIYKVADLEVFALQGLDLEVQPGEIIAIVGASGSGKSTLLNILSGMDNPSAGKYFVDSYDMTALSASKRVVYQREVIGQIWQQSGRNLFPEMNAQTNVELPLMVGQARGSYRKQRARELLAMVGLADTGHKLPEQFSGGEQQRLSIAVALANGPKLLLADEPTGELDSTTATEIMTLLRQLNKELGITIITVTHDIAIAAMVDRTIAISGGRTSTETIRREQPGILMVGEIEKKSTVIGLSSQTHRESVIIDRLGRLQLPKEALERIPFNGRAEIIVEGERVILSPMKDEKN